MAILGGLHMACISRLKLTNIAVREKTTDQLKKLQEVMDPGRSAHNYRTVLKTSTVPCIPYLYVYIYRNLLNISNKRFAVAHI